MRICVLGTGYVGLITACGFAKLGHDVRCVDIDPKKVESINAGIPPIYEDKLESLLKEVVNKTLHATLDYKEALKGAEFCFICVPTPSDAHGAIDLRFISNAFDSLLGSMHGPLTVAVKSTVVPGTTDSLVARAKAKGKTVGKDLYICMNPEFLREGKAVDDFFTPDRIVIGGYDEKSANFLKKLYQNFTCPIILTDLKTAEMIKYASNSFLATKLSFMNEIGNVSKALGIDVYQVLEGMKHDKRIGGIFMNAGVGFGGSCFPKDVSALATIARNAGVEPRVLDAVLSVNKEQPRHMIALAKKHRSLSGAHVAVLGVAFKPDTDDIRESPALAVIEDLLKEGAHITVFDPKALPNARAVFGEKISYATSPNEALQKAQVAFIMTEWGVLKDPSLYSHDLLIIDGRNVVRRKENYEGICW